MDKLIYTEEQFIRQNPISWIILPVWLGLVALFTWGFYQQLYLGKPWGDNPTSDTALLTIGISIILFTGAIFMMVFNARLITEIHSNGIYYKYPPFINKLRFIDAGSIASYEVRKYNPIGEYGGWGLRKGYRRRNTAYNVSGSAGLVLKLKNGMKYTFGTVKPDDLRQAVEKMMSGKS